MWLYDANKTPHRFKELDSLRAFAILGVMYAHFVSGDDSFLGNLGVELFFVLSGYLITGILLRCRSFWETGESTLPTIFMTFYIRRALRILPVFYLCLSCLWFAGAQEVRQQIWWHATFNSNLLFVLSTSFSYLTPHFWSLAVEEQFYLIWPAIILLAPRRYLCYILLAVIAIGPIYRTIAVVAGFSDSVISIVMFSCLDDLGMGALLAYFLNHDRERRMLLKLGLWSLPVPLFLAIFGEVLPVTHKLFFLTRTLSALAFAWIIDYSVKSPKIKVVGFLRSPFLVSIGMVSYGAYIFHLPAAFLLKSTYFHAFGQGLDRGPMLFILASGLTLIMATVSWKLLEEPINSLKSYWPYQTRTAIMTGAETPDSSEAAS